MNFYCIAVRTGCEEIFIESVKDCFEPNGELNGSLHFLKKQMRLKTGKEYYDPFFPGYVFLETTESNSEKLCILERGKNFLRFLPSNQEINPMTSSDLRIISSILQFGNTVGIVPVIFDAGDKIKIVDGPFKDFSGKVKSVNRRNKRVNLEIDFLGAMREISLSYSLVEKIN